MGLFNRKEKEVELTKEQQIDEILEDHKNVHYMLIYGEFSDFELETSDLNYIYSKGWKVISHAYDSNVESNSFIFEKILD
jgi:hypothetical protein